MSKHTKRRRSPVADAFPAGFVNEVAAASRAYVESWSRPEEEVRLSEGILGRIFDACPDRAALEALNQRADAGLTCWIPDAAVAMWRVGRGADGAALLARLAHTLGIAPFPPALLEGMIEGVARWCDRIGGFEIELPPARLATLVADLEAACPTPKRIEQLGVVLDRDLFAWIQDALDLLAEAGEAWPGTVPASRAG
jgi:hypothetical protein